MAEFKIGSKILWTFKNLNEAYKKKMSEQMDLKEKKGKKSWE